MTQHQDALVRSISLDELRGIPVSPLLREPAETYQQAKDRLAKNRQGGDS